jgi:hypothetical protein
VCVLPGWLSNRIEERKVRHRRAMHGMVDTSLVTCIDCSQFDHLDKVGKIGCGASDGWGTRLVLMILEKS